MSIVDRIQAAKNVYVGNAQAVRDFRSQLRGSKPVWIWGLYLTAIVLTVGYEYVLLVNRGMSIADSSQILYQVFQMLMGLLYVVTMLVAPGLTASTVTMERQRHSLDLIACAPVETRYFLVGKMISSFRYIWMLLVLALPAAAFTVVLGGASWQDVFALFVSLSTNALVLTAISLLISTKSRNTAMSLLLSYGAALGYSIGSAALVSRFYTSHLAGLVPVGLIENPSISIPILGAQIPVYALSAFLNLTLVGYFVLASGASMAHIGSKDAVKFRLASLALTGIGTFAAAREWFEWYPEPGDLNSYYIYGTLFAGLGAVIISTISTLFVAELSDKDQDRKSSAGIYGWKQWLSGQAHGTLPYALAAYTVFASATVAAFQSVSESPLFTIPTFIWGFLLIAASGEWTRLITRFRMPVGQARGIATISWVMLLFAPIANITGLRFTQPLAPLFLGDKPAYDVIYMALAVAFIFATRRLAATIKEPTPKIETQTPTQSLSASQVARDLYVTNNSTEEVSNHT